MTTWRGHKTVGDSDIAHAESGHLRDAPGNRGTEMKIVIDCEPPGVRAFAVLAAFGRLLGQAPDAKIREDLRRFKMRLETGDVATVNGQNVREIAHARAGMTPSR